MILGFQGKMLKKEDLDKLLSQFASDKGYKIKEKEVLRYSNFGIANQEGTKLTIFEKDKTVSNQNSFHGIWPKDYENMTGQKLSLSGNEVGLFAKMTDWKDRKL